MSIPVWLSNNLYNRLDGSYINGDCDVTGNVICRGNNSIWMDSNVSLKLNSATPVTLSIAELATLDAITTGVSIQTQLNGKATTGDVTALQTKTQNITATSVLTTIEDNVTLSTGNLELTNGDLTVAGTKSFFMNGELNLGSLGRISGTGLTISNAQLAYLNGLTANIESRVSSVVTKTQNITATSVLTTFEDSIILTAGNLTLTLGNLVLTSGNLTLTLGNLSLSNGDLSIISGKSILNNGILNFGTTGNITVNGSNISNAQIGYLTGLTSSVETRLGNNATSITNLNTKTQNITATASLTTFSNGITVSSGTSTFQASSFTGTMTFSTGFALNIGGSSRINLVGANSYINITGSLGILTTGSIYISGTELSMLDGATVNIPTAINNINSSLTDLNLKTTDITYVAVPATTTIANAVSCTGSLKVSQQTWLDGSVKLKTTWVAPSTGELAFTTTSNLASQITTFVNSTAKNIVSFTLPIGVWLMTYNVLTNLTGGVFSSIFIGVTTTNNGLAGSLVSQITQPNIPYTGEIRFSTSRVINVSTSTTYYLTGYFSFTGTSPAINTPTYLEATRIG